MDGFISRGGRKTGGAYKWNFTVLYEIKLFKNILIVLTVNSRYCWHPRDLKFVPVITGVCNSEVRKKIPQFYF